MRTKKIAPIAIAILVLTAACSDPAPSEEPSNGAEEQGSTAPEDEPSPTEADTPAEGESPEPDDITEQEDEGFPSDPLTVTIGSDEADFAPTDVYCKVGGGELRHLIAKTDNRPPLLEVTPGEFAILKLEKKGAPEKSTDPSGIEYRTDGVIFTDAKIGSATLDGALACTEVENN